MSDIPDSGKRCQAMKKDGTPCTAPAVRGGHCIGHQGADNIRWRARGGAGTARAQRAAKLLPSRLRPLVEGLERAFAALEKGDIEPREATALATVAVAIVRVYQAGEQEERLREIEQQIAAWQHADRGRWQRGGSGAS